MAKNQGPWGNNDNANPWGDNEETLNSPKVVDFSVLERIKKDDGFDFKIRWALLALLVIVPAVDAVQAFIKFSPANRASFCVSALMPTRPMPACTTICPTRLKASKKSASLRKEASPSAKPLTAAAATLSPKATC